ncbi:DUF4041 domain-containing protein [Blastococcus sp. MG754426]|uniref:DUF4041 domain-containing protein n=1 Tax=Blastococcus sp. MG754426 TaxID=2570317 RepID=UPI001F2B8DF1|nr:DUF4041 domain-containing protein [Blastococcus sp. MG754426]
MPDPTWPPAPPGWEFWVPDEAPVPPQPTAPTPPPVAEAPTPSAPPSPAPAPTPAPEPPRPSRHAAPDEPDDTVLVGASAAPPPPAATARVRELEAEVDALRRQLAEAERRATEQRPTGDDDFVELDDARLLQQVGIYHYHHPLENAELYRERLAELREQIKEMVKAGKAIEASDRFSFNNSLAAGRRMTADFSKLMLRAYNAEADNCVRALRAGALAAATKRLETAAGTIARLGQMMEMRVSPEYHALRITELELTADYLFKQQEEREAAREERERLREERKAEQELAAQREKLDKERAHYLNTLAALRAQGAVDDVADIENRLAAIDAAIEENDYRAANIRAGYVYVVSNIGAFGKSVVKIGMTRRLEPMDRIRELGDASVPFPFDVHALYFSDDAVTLENELHAAFAARRLNHANPRREFFFATPEEVRDVLAEKVGNLLEYAATPEAEQFHQSLSSWPAGVRGEPAA